MPNLANVLKEEIRRLARKEIKEDIARIRKDSAVLKRTAADLKRRVARLEADNKRLVAEAAKQRKESAQPVADESQGARISAKTIRQLRTKFKMSREQFGKLLGVSSQSIYQWERQEGRLALRDRTKQAVVEVRRLGAREAQTRLEAVAAKSAPAKGKRKKAAAKPSKRKTRAKATRKRR